MESKIEKKRIGRKGKIAIAAAAVALAAGASVYAVNATGDISETEARQIALAQVNGADHSHMTKFRKDMDDGREEYDVEIIYGGYEYDFEISAKDGRIYDQSKERVGADDIAGLPPSSAQLPDVESEAPSVTIEVQPDPQAAQPAQSASDAAGTQSYSTADIGLEKAKSIALGQVSGASAGDIRMAFNDYDDGRLEYDVEIIYNGYEYDFEIDGATGKILSKDVDRMEYDDYYDYD